MQENSQEFVKFLGDLLVLRLEESAKEKVLKGKDAQKNEDEFHPYIFKLFLKLSYLRESDKAGCKELVLKII